MKTYKLRIPIGKLFQFLKLDNDLHETFQHSEKNVKIKTPSGAFTPILKFVKKQGFVATYNLEDGSSIKCDVKHLIKQKSGDFVYISNSDHVIKDEKSIKIISKSEKTKAKIDVYDIAIDSPHEYVTSNGVVSHNTSAAFIIVNNLDCDYLYLNVSDENSIDVVRTKIKSFASTTGFKKWKIVILDESEMASHSFMTSLKVVLEQYSINTRFILITNVLDKIILPIQSRCQTYKVEPPNKKDIAIHLKNILDKESVKYSIQDIKYIVNTYYPDIRKVINFAQQSSMDGQMTIRELNSVSTSTKTDILELLKSPNSSTFNNIRQLLANSGVRQFEDYYGYLYEKIDDYSKDKQTVIIFIIAEYMYQSSLVIHKEITFMACVAKILSAILENNN